jgi:uncharacterized protein (DUF4415 family)
MAALLIARNGIGNLSAGDALGNLPRDLTEPITLCLDEDVIEFFRQEGDRYQTRMNAVLRAFMEHARRAR